MRYMIVALEAISCIALIVTLVLWVMEIVNLIVPIGVWLVFAALVVIDVDIDSRGY